MVRIGNCLWRSAALLAGLALLTGCDRSIAPVSGRVTLNGKPLADAVVTFQPVGRRGPSQPATTGSVGRTDDAGRFTLRLVEPDRAGAAVGEHIVTVTTAIGGSDDSPPADERSPRAWRDGSKRFTVPAGGTHSANFELTGG